MKEKNDSNSIHAYLRSSNEIVKFIRANGVECDETRRPFVFSVARKNTCLGCEENTRNEKRKKDIFNNKRYT